MDALSSFRSAHWYLVAIFYPGGVDAGPDSGSDDGGEVEDVDDDDFADWQNKGDGRSDRSGKSANATPATTKEKASLPVMPKKYGLFSGPV
jgi:hypothetical protein